MGVPAFFRWLTKKYPSVIVHCIEEKVKEIDGVKIPVDTTAPNPNGVEFDNLYLDMNGIIHPCTHPENKPAPKNEEEMMVAIFECIDRLFRIVRPRKLLYMAIDGVAPRAKMNQQRSRRFRASKEVAEKINEIERIRADLESQGCKLPPAKPKGDHFDSNCITPGTPFMDRLAKCLHYYVHERMNSDPGWKNIKVILSDANSPGEGEHKIMDYIRRQRAQPGHDPNTSHCLCGADADLIMLGLATHEPNFTIIREEFKPNAPRPCEICNTVGHDMKDCLGLEKEVPEDGPEPPAFGSELEFIFVRVNVLREYLEKELNMPNLPFKFDIERAVDDWVFMCFFVGNDFLPHLPSLEIRENAIDRLVRLYKDCVYKTKGWLTDSGIPDLNRVQLIMSNLGEAEDEIFYRRQENELHFKARQKAQKKRKTAESANCYNRPSFSPRGQFAPMPIGQSPSPVNNPRNEAYNMRIQGMHTNADGNIARSNQNAAVALKAMLTSGESPSSTANDSISSVGSSSSLDSSPGNVSVSASPSRELALKRKATSAIESDEEEANDEVRLWEEGFKNRYYESKFDVAPDNFKFRQEVANQYVRGLCWVLRYYYQGCASWEWYYPYHYAPFASDLVNIGDLSTEFEKNTKPFLPMEQLMSVFPAASRAHVPEPWGKLMYDPESPIIDFYPIDFQIDLNGKKFAWQGVALLPFVDERRLKDVLAEYQHLLTEDELRRNSRGDDRLYVRRGHACYDFLNGLYENSMDSDEEIPLDHEMCQGMGGTVLIAKDVVPEKGTLICPISGQQQPDVYENETITVRFRDLKFDENHIFPAVRLPNAVDPPKVLKPGDLTAEQNRNYRPQIGMARSTQRASLDSSGHQALSNFVSRGGSSGRGSYSNMPPPNSGSSYNSREDSYGGGGRSRSEGSSGSSYRISGSSYDRGYNGSNNNSRGGGGGGGGGYRGSGSYETGGGSRYNAGGTFGGNGGGYNSGRHSDGYSYSGGNSGGYNSGGGSRGGYRGGSGGGYRGGGQQGYGGGSNSSNWRSDDRSSRGGGQGQQRQGYYTTGYNQQR